MSSDEDAEALEEEEALRASGRLYLTQAGAERLHAELLALLKVERPRVTAEVSAAAAQGDRSENAEYLYGKKRLREIDRRIRFLQRRLDNSTVVNPRDQKDHSRVYFGATLVLEDEDGKRTTYQLVGADETDARGGRISVDSPLGRALLGRPLGSSVTVLRPLGEVEVTIIAIRYE
jgi:transcription elongation factor GreB